ncbi:hypothetical protein QF026_000233 [Streptomyces aurantiacus]|nr:hypothetical protein [Streptomyces aurantiacus]
MPSSEAATSIEALGESLIARFDHLHMRHTDDWL